MKTDRNWPIWALTYQNGPWLANLDPDLSKRTAIDKLGPFSTKTDRIWSIWTLNYQNGPFSLAHLLRPPFSKNETVAQTLVSAAFESPSFSLRKVLFILYFRSFQSENLILALAQKYKKRFVIHLEHFQCMLFKILAQQKHFYQFSKIFGVWLSRIFLSHGPKLLGHYRDPRTKRVQERDETSNLVSLNHEEVDSVLIWSYVQWLRLF